MFEVRIMRTISVRVGSRLNGSHAGTRHTSGLLVLDLIDTVLHAQGSGITGADTLARATGPVRSKPAKNALSRMRCMV